MNLDKEFDAQARATKDHIETLEKHFIQCVLSIARDTVDLNPKNKMSVELEYAQTLAHLSGFFRAAATMVAAPWVEMNAMSADWSEHKANQSFRSVLAEMKRADAELFAALARNNRKRSTK